MIEWVQSLGAWNWLILGAVLLGVEMVAPGMFMLWLGIAALLVGVISFAVDWSWQAQCVAFAFFAIAAIPLWRRLARGPKWSPDQPFLNRRTEAMIGRVFTLEKPIVNGSGTVRVGDTIWRVSGPDCPAGSKVKVAAADGVDLRVEPE